MLRRPVEATRQNQTFGYTCPEGLLMIQSGHCDTAAKFVIGSLACPIRAAGLQVHERDTHKHIWEIRMKRNFSLVFFFLLMISEYGHAQSIWTAVNEVDPFTDEQLKGVVYEDDTHRIQISIENEKSIAMYLDLKRGTFEPNTTLELRVDKNPLMVSEPMSDILNEVMTEHLGMPAYRWTPSTLVILFASIANLAPTAPNDIDEAANFCVDRMTQFLNGQSLIGGYYVSDASRGTFNVSLEGFKEAANQVFEIGEVRNDNPHCLR